MPTNAPADCTSSEILPEPAYIICHISIALILDSERLAHASAPASHQAPFDAADALGGARRNIDAPIEPAVNVIISSACSSIMRTFLSPRHVEPGRGIDDI